MPGAEVRPAPVAADLAAVAGAVISLLAHLVLPMLSAPAVGSRTAGDLAAEFSVASSMAFAPILAVLSAAVGVWLALRRPDVLVRQLAGGVVLLDAVLIALAYVWPLGGLAAMIGQPGLTMLEFFAGFVGPGFWVGCAGVVVQGAAGVLMLLGARDRWGLPTS